MLILSFAPSFATLGSITVTTDKPYQINYDAKDVKVLGAQPNTSDQGIDFSLQVSSPVATLQVTIPRELLDDKNKDGTDGNFIILVDGTFSSSFIEQKTPATRSILVQLSPENKDLEIIGTTLAGTGSVNLPFNNTQPTPPPVQTTPLPTLPTPPPSTPPTTSQNPPAQNVTQSPQNQPNATAQKSIPTATNPPLSQLSHLFEIKLPAISTKIPIKDLIEYGVIAGIILIIILAITATAKSSTRKPLRRY